VPPTVVAAKTHNCPVLGKFENTTCPTESVGSEVMTPVGPPPLIPVESVTRIDARAAPFAVVRVTVVELALGVVFGVLFVLLLQATTARHAAATITN